MSDILPPLRGGWMVTLTSIPSPLKGEGKREKLLWARGWL